MRQTFSSCALCKQVCSNDRKWRMTGWGWFVSHMLPVWSCIWFRSSSWRSDRDRRSEAQIDRAVYKYYSVSCIMDVCLTTLALWIIEAEFCCLCPQVLCFSMCFLVRFLTFVKLKLTVYKMIGFCVCNAKREAKRLARKGYNNHSRLEFIVCTKATNTRDVLEHVKHKIYIKKYIIFSKSFLP